MSRTSKTNRKLAQLAKIRSVWIGKPRFRIWNTLSRKETRNLSPARFSPLCPSGKEKPIWREKKSVLLSLMAWATLASRPCSTAKPNWPKQSRNTKKKLGFQLTRWTLMQLKLIRSFWCTWRKIICSMSFSTESGTRQLLWRCWP